MAARGYVVLYTNPRGNIASPPCPGGVRRSSPPSTKRIGVSISRSGKPQHRIERLQHIVGWFDKWLLGAATDVYDLK